MAEFFFYFFASIFVAAILGSVAGFTVVKITDWLAD